MPTIYHSDTSLCGACNARIKSSKYIGFYLIGSRAAIGYALCKTCGKHSRTALPPALLKQLDGRMEAEARQYGLTTTH